MEAKGKIKGQGVHVHVMRIHSGVSSITVPILNFGTTWNGQVHAPAALPPEKNSLADVEKAESALEPVSTIPRREKPATNRNRTTVLRLCRP